MAVAIRLASAPKREIGLPEQRTAGTHFSRSCHSPLLRATVRNTSLVIAINRNTVMTRPTRIIPISIRPTSIRHSPISHTRMGHSGMRHIRFGHPGMRHTGIRHTRINHAGIGHAGISHTSISPPAIGPLMKVRNLELLAHCLDLTLDRAKECDADRSSCHNHQGHLSQSREEREMKITSHHSHHMSQRWRQERQDSGMVTKRTGGDLCSGTKRSHGSEDKNRPSLKLCTVVPQSSTLYGQLDGEAERKRAGAASSQTKRRTKHCRTHKRGRHS